MYLVHLRTRKEAGADLGLPHPCDPDCCFSQQPWDTGRARLNVLISQRRKTEMQRPEEHRCQTQAGTKGPPDPAHQHLASGALFVRRRQCCGSLRETWLSGPSGGGAILPGPIPRRFWRPHSQLGNSETKVPASNCLLSKAQPASSATGRREREADVLGRGGGGVALWGLCYLG